MKKLFLLLLGINIAYCTDGSNLLSAKSNANQPSRQPQYIVSAIPTNVAKSRLNKPGTYCNTVPDNCFKLNFDNKQKSCLLSLNNQNIQNSDKNQVLNTFIDSTVQQQNDIKLPVFKIISKQDNIVELGDNSKFLEKKRLRDTLNQKKPTSLKYLNKNKKVNLSNKDVEIYHYNEKQYLEKHVSENHASEHHVSEDNVSEKHVSEHHVSEDNVSKNRVSEHHVSENHVSASVVSSDDSNFCILAENISKNTSNKRQPENNEEINSFTFGNNTLNISAFQLENDNLPISAEDNNNDNSAFQPKNDNLPISTGRLEGNNNDNLPISSFRLGNNILPTFNPFANINGRMTIENASNWNDAIQRSQQFFAYNQILNLGIANHILNRELNEQCIPFIFERDPQFHWGFECDEQKEGNQNSELGIPKNEDENDI